jgi:hypothetical protein
MAITLVPTTPIDRHDRRFGAPPLPVIAALAVAVEVEVVDGRRMRMTLVKAQTSLASAAASALRASEWFMSPDTANRHASRQSR